MLPTGRERTDREGRGFRRVRLPAQPLAVLRRVGAIGSWRMLLWEKDRIGGNLNSVPVGATEQ